MSPQRNNRICTMASAYNKVFGFPKLLTGIYLPVNEGRARLLADAFEALPVDDAGTVPVREAYAQLAREVEQQWQFAQLMGIQFESWKRSGQPYENSSQMRADVRQNMHLYFYQGGEPHPLFAAIDAENGFSINDKFRAIHDLFGHAAEGYGFGPRGEENAWLKHSQMFSKEAQKALTTETRGQNCWVNYGRHNYDAAGRHTNLPLRERPYAMQKAALLPDEFADWKGLLQ